MLNGVVVGISNSTVKDLNEWRRVTSVLVSKIVFVNKLLSFLDPCSTVGQNLHKYVNISNITTGLLYKGLKEQN